MRIALTTLAVLFTAVFAGCVGIKPSGTAPLAAVSPMPEPAHESMIVSHAPSGPVDRLDQIRVRFASDLIPLTELESPAENTALSHFRIEPNLPGHFRFLTPKLVGFQADAALPLATRVKVTVSAGLTDVAQHRLPQDFSWTFATDRVTFDSLPGNDGPNLDSSPLHPQIAVVSNVAVDRSSLVAHAKLVSRDGKNVVPLTFLPLPVASATASPAAVDAFDPAETKYQYTLVPVHDLAKATTYDIVIAPGVVPVHGNLPSAEAATGALQTFDPLRFTGAKSSLASDSDDDPGRFSAGAPVLSFNNSVTAQSARKAITISPAPRDSTHLVGIDSDGSKTVSINPDLLVPNTDYTIHIAESLTDEFGQTLGSDARATFRTGDLTARVWAPGGSVIFPPSRNLGLNIVSTNLAKAHAQFQALKPIDLITIGSPYDLDRSGVLLDQTTWPVLALGGTPNVEKTTPISLRAKLGSQTGVLAYGVTAGVKPRAYKVEGLVQITNLGVFAQWFPQSGFVRVHRLSDGTPVAGASVDIYPSLTDDDKSGQRPLVCAHRTTDVAGIATFDASAFARCAATDDGKGAAPPFFTVVRSGSDWAYVHTRPYDGSYIPGADNGWSSSTPQSRGTIFSDRDLYQPGETVNVTGVGWFLTDGVLARGHAPLYTVTLSSPSGIKRQLKAVHLNAFGTFSQAIPLPKNAELGYWNIVAAAGTGEELDGSFRIAEFKPPNFKVDLTLDASVAVPGQDVKAAADSQYLFGSPVEGAKSAFSVTRAPANLAPPKHDDYTFGRQWYWPDTQPDATTDVAQTQTRVDASGKSGATVTVANDLPYPMTYRVDAETTDVSNLAVSDSKSFTALPSKTLIGLKAPFVGTAGNALDVNVITTDIAGTSVPGAHVTVALQRAEYASATALVEGAESAQTAVKYTTVASADVTTATAAAIAHLTPPKAGTYRIHANVAGASNDATATDAQVWVSGDTSVDWNQPDPNVLKVQLDKQTYAIGDTATALIASPFAKGDLYVAVVRGRIFWKKVQAVQGAAPTVRFTVTPEMLPNAAVEAVLVHRGAPPPNATSSLGNAFARTGLAGFDVDLGAKYVHISATPAHLKIAPGQKQDVRLHVTGSNGKPVHAQLTVIVANEAVLQLTGYRPPDLVKIVYETQPISTRFSDNRTRVVLTSPMQTFEKGFGYGGGLSSGNADTRVRRNFSALASFTGAVVTDANGDAHVAFTLPDDLTTWRVMAVAATVDGHFGNTDATFTSTLPVLANPVVPQFARPGDRFDAGVAVTNAQKRTGSIDIAGKLSGPLAFVVANAMQADTTFHGIADPITHAYRFSMAAGYPGTATAQFHVMLGGASDAFAIPVPVLDRAVTESVVTTGTTRDSVTIPLDVQSAVPLDTGGLNVVVANTILPDVLTAVTKAFNNDVLYSESIAARLSIAADLVSLAHNGVAAPGIDANGQARTQLIALAKLQRPDGGFPTYPFASSSDAFSSTVVLSALGRAAAAGIAVDPEMLRTAKGYVSDVLDDPTAQLKWCKTPVCKAWIRVRALDALAQAGDRRTSFLGDLLTQSVKLDVADAIRLARLIAQSPGYTVQSEQMFTELSDRMYETGSSSMMNVPQVYGWSGTATVLQSQAIRLFLAHHAPAEQIDKITRSLLALRRDGSWGCTCADAEALSALADVAEHEGRPLPFAVSGKFNSPPPPDGAPWTLGAQLSDTKRVSASHIAMADVPRGPSSLGLRKQGEGVLHYAVTYTYRLSGPQPGQYAGLRVTREVHPANTAMVLATMGLLMPAQTVSLPVGNVYDVGLQIISDHPVDRVIIDDPLPAGMEAVDTTFKTSTAAFVAQGDSWEISYQQIHHDRIEAYADRLGPGMYVLHYLVRTVTPGTYAWPGAQARLLNSPEEFGRSAATTLTVK